MGSETISAVMSALAVILGMIGAMFSVKHTASSIEKTSDGDAKEAKEAAQKVQEGNKDIISLMLNNMSELREYYVINKRQANRVFNATLTACVMGGIIFIIGSINRIIYDLEDEHIAFFKQDESVSIFRNVFASEPRAALRYLLQRLCSLFKFDCKPLCCCRADLCQKCGVGHQHLSGPC